MDSHRKSRGIILGLILVLYVIFAPIWMAALFVRWLGSLILVPFSLLWSHMVIPNFVDLMYIHRIGSLHPKIVGKGSKRRPHSRPTRTDVKTASGALVSIHSIAQLHDNFGYLLINRQAAPSWASRLLIQSEIYNKDLHMAESGPFRQLSTQHIHSLSRGHQSIDINDTVFDSTNPSFNMVAEAGRRPNINDIRSSADCEVPAGCNVAGNITLTSSNKDVTEPAVFWRDKPYEGIHGVHFSEEHLLQSEPPTENRPRISGESDVLPAPYSVQNGLLPDTTLRLKGVLIDCGDAKGCKKAIDGIMTAHYPGLQLEIEAVLTTHHHWDHMGGNKKIRNLYPSISKIYSSRIDRVVGSNVKLDHEETFTIAGMTFQAILTPCHTKGSLVYRLYGENRRDCMFVGDTMFCGGCGAHFEGTPNDMARNFAHILLTSGPDSLIFPGHEYTERILQEYFPHKLASLNTRRFFDLCAALCRAMHLRSLAYPAPTLPVRLREEVSYNLNFDPVLKACALLKLAAKKYWQQHSGESYSDDTDLQRIINTTGEIGFDVCLESQVSTVFDSRKSCHLKPRLIEDDEGQIYVLEPPWITNSSELKFPWLFSWRSDIAYLIRQMETAHPVAAK